MRPVRPTRARAPGGSFICGVVLELGDARLDHLVQVVPLARAPAHAAKDGEATVGLGDVVDELLDQHGLADAGTTKEADLAAAGVGGQEADDLDARLEHLDGGGLVDEGKLVPETLRNIARKAERTMEI